MSKSIYDRASHSRLEPSSEQVAMARQWQTEMRGRGYVIVYSVEQRQATLEAMAPAVVRRLGIPQKRLNADDRAAWEKWRPVVSIAAERAWIRAGLTKADEKAKTNSLGLFDEVIRVFPGTRFVERRSSQS